MAEAEVQTGSDFDGAGERCSRSDPVPRAAAPHGLVIDEGLLAAVLYVAIGAGLLFLITIAASLRQAVWAAYTGLVLLGLIYVACFEQNLSGVVWMGLDLPETGLLFGGYMMFSINPAVAGWSLPRTAQFERMSRGLQVAAVLVWAFWLMGAQAAGLGQCLWFTIAGNLLVAGHVTPVRTVAQ